MLTMRMMTFHVSVDILVLLFWLPGRVVGPEPCLVYIIDDKNIDFRIKKHKKHVFFTFIKTLKKHA